MRPLIVAHRGDSKYYPENTRSAFISAMEKGADILETDIRETKDGKLVCIHDAYIDRITNWKHSGFVKDLNSELFERIEVINPLYGKRDKIIFLEEFLELTRGKRVIIEIKEPCIEKKVVEKILEYGKEEEAIVSSFVWDILDRVWISKLDQPIKRVIIYDNLPEDFFKQIYMHQASGFAISYRSLKPIIAYEKAKPQFIAKLSLEDRVREMKELRKDGKLVGVYTIDDPKIIKEVSNYVDIIVTNDPGLAKTCLE